MQDYGNELPHRFQDYGNATKAYFKKDLSVLLRSQRYDDTKFIKKRLETVSFIHLNFDDSQAILVVKDAHFTLFGIIGDIGGILGIFLGFSCTGLIDLALGVMESVMSYVMYKNKKKNPANLD